MHDEKENTWRKSYFCYVKNEFRVLFFMQFENYLTGTSTGIPSLHDHKDERTHKQFHKLRKKLEARQKDSPVIISSHNNSNPPSPKKGQWFQLIEACYMHIGYIQFNMFHLAIAEVKKFKDRNTSTSGLGDESGIQSPEGQ